MPYTFQETLSLYLQLEAELKVFLRNYYKESLPPADERFSLYCSQVNYHKREMNLGLRNVKSLIDDAPIFLQGGYFG